MNVMLPCSLNSQTAFLPYILDEHTARHISTRSLRNLSALLMARFE